MHSESGQNMRILRVLRGGRYGTRQSDAEREMEAKTRERTARRIAASGRAQDKALYNVAEDRTHPTRHDARLIRKAHAAKWTKAGAREVFVDPRIDYIDAVWDGKPDRAA